MDISESSTARASQDSLYYDIDEKEFPTFAAPEVDKITPAGQSPAALELTWSELSKNFLAESGTRFGYKVRK